MCDDSAWFELEEVLEDGSTYSSSAGAISNTEQYSCYDDTPLRREQLVQKRVGRHMACTTQLFSLLRTKNEKPLKKEYMRCQIIRGIKKCLRCMVEGRAPKTGIHQFNPQDQEKAAIWQILVQLVEENKELLAPLGSTCEGPATDGKIIRQRQRLGAAQHLSFNDDYCKRFYKHEVIRQFHYHFMQLVYGVRSVDVAEVTKKLKVFCCSGGHDGRCEETWGRVRQYVMVEMIKQLGLEPYMVEEDFNVEGIRNQEEDDPDYLLALDNPF